MSAALTFEAVKPGDWVPTGWGAQHKVRSVQADHVVFACHGATDDQRAEKQRVRLEASEDQRCSHCERANGLAPFVPGVVGEVRRTPEGWIGICVTTRFYNKWVLLDPAPERWTADWFMANATRTQSVEGGGS